MPDHSRDINLRTCFSEGVLLLAASVLAYACAFAFEVGYCRHFGIPVSFIRLTTETLLVSGASFLFAASLVILVLNTLVSSLASVENPTAVAWIAASRVHLVAAGAAVCVFVISGFDLKIGLTVSIVVVIFLVDLLQALSIRNETPLLTRFQGVQRAASDDRNLFAFIRQKVGGQRYTAALICFLILMAAWQAGSRKARLQRMFLVPSDTTNTWVVLRHYGDALICAEIDQKAKLVRANYQVLKAGEPEDRKFQCVDIGRLTLDPKVAYKIWNDPGI